MKNNTVKNEIKGYIAKSGMTMTQVAAEYDKNYEPMSLQNLSNKLARGKLKYEDCIKIAGIIGYEIVWKKVEN